MCFDLLSGLTIRVCALMLRWTVEMILHRLQVSVDSVVHALRSRRIAIDLRRVVFRTASRAEITMRGLWDRHRDAPRLNLFRDAVPLILIEVDACALRSIKRSFSQRR